MPSPELQTQGANTVSETNVALSRIQPAPAPDRTVRQQRVEYFDREAATIEKTLAGKRIDFGKIGWVDGAEVVIDKLTDRSQAPNVPGVKSEFGLAFDVHRVQKVDGANWRGTMIINNRYGSQGELTSQDVQLWPGSKIEAGTTPIRMPDRTRDAFLEPVQNRLRELMKNAPDLK